MIWHFIRRDFNSSRFQWAILLLLTLSTLPFLLNETEHTRLISSGVLGYSYILFVLFSIHPVFGSVWRNQHSMSRYYLLALPIKRSDAFNVNILRSFVFAIPLGAFLLIEPFLVTPTGPFENLRGHIFIYWIATFLVGLWGITFLAKSQVSLERISGYVSAQTRLRRGILTFLTAIVEVWTVMGLWALTVVAPGLIGLAGLLGIIAVLYFRYLRTRKLWAGY